MHVRTVFTSVALLAGLMPLPSVSAGDQATAGQHVAAAQAHQGKGTVREIDTGKARVKIDHGPITSLGWSGMTMFFNVASAELLAGLKPGDKVTFTLTRDKNGRILISTIVKD